MDAYVDEHLEAWNLQWECWNFTKANIARDIGDLEQAITVLRHMQEVLTGNDRVQSGLPPHVIELMLLTLTPELLASNGNWKLAMKKAKRALEALQRVSPPMKSAEMYMRILLCFGLDALGRHQELDAELEAAVSEDDSQVSNEHLTMLRLLQAKAALRLGDTAAAWAHTQVAETLAAKDIVSLVAVKYHQAYVMREQQQWMSAAKLAGEAAVLAAAQQRDDCYQDNEPTSWVLFFDHHMNSVYWLLQELWIKHLRRPERGLLWAERANVRHLLHQIHKEGEEEQLFDPVELEHCDTLLESIIWATVKSLSPTTAIIHYVYNTSYGKLFMYVSRHSAESTSGVAVFCTICQLSTWFRDAGEPPTTLLEEVVRKARTDIMNNEDSKGPIKALATLHALLVQFIEADLEGCDTLIFAPGHGCLSLVPFAALYDGRKGKFLVQVQATKGVAVIPSITTLYRCLQQQDKFHARMQFPYPDEVPFLESVFGQELHRKGEMMQDSWQPSKVAFIGGNPEPMGLGWPPLDFALHEAIAVASYFNVQPCLGRNMTKKAVLEGLADSGVVLLATHGMVDEARYPHGCLVMQGPAGCSTTRETDAHGATEKGHRSAHVFQGTDASSRLLKEQEAGQVLTASEIANLEGGIAAGLVVLSACESGQGEVTGSEGLVGLGRALLQAGAPTAVLTLWKVRDGHQMWMVAGLFHVLYVDSRTRGTTVCQALQIMMEGWIRQGIPIYSWASLSIVGSPLLHLGCSACEDGLSLAKTLYDREIWPHCAQTSCMVCDRHRRRLLSLTECQTLVERTAKNC